MKIVHCLDHYMPVHMAGTEIYVHTLVKLQKADGHEVVVLTPFFSFYPDRQFKEHYVYDTVDVYQYMEPSVPADKNILSGKKLPEGIKEFGRQLSILKPDIIHFHELTRGIGLGVAHVEKAKQTAAKVMLTLHLASNTCNTGNLINHGRLCPGQILEYDCSVCSYKTLNGFPAGIAVPITAVGMFMNRTGILSKLPQTKITTLLSIPAAIQRIRKDLDALIGYVDRFISLTEWYKKILLLNGVPEDKITVVPQALTIGQRSIKELDRMPAALPLRLVFVGRIQVQKGVHLLIDAVNQLNKAEVTLDIYGREEDTAYYHHCFEQSKNNPAIAWKGLIAREEVIPRLAAYHILCLPSTFSEMSPFVIQEAFAAGIPVLASRVYGNAEQITDEINGWLFNFNSSKDLTKKITMLIKEPALVENARKKIARVDGFDTVAIAYEKIYTQFFPETT